MAILGNFLAFYLNGQRVAMATGNNVSIKTDIVDITNNDSGSWGEIMPTRHTLSGSVEAFFCSSIDNLLQFPEAFGNAAWSKDTGVAVTDNTDSNGNTTPQKIADTITWNAGAFIQQIIADTLTIGNIVTGSIWVKGIGTIKLTVGDDAGSTDSANIVLSGTWTRVSVSHTLGSAVDVFFKITKVSGTAVILDRAMLNIGSSALAYRGSTELYAALQDAEINKTLIPFRYTTDIQGDMNITGNMYITQLDVKATNNDAMKFTCNINGTGLSSVGTIS